MRQEFSEDKNTPENQPSNMSLPHVAAFDFFASAIIWFDIIACVSTGAQPHLADHHYNLLSATADFDEPNTVQLDRVMGCQNWAMIIISQVAVLASAHREDNPDIQALTVAAKDIQRRLAHHNEQTLTELTSLQLIHNGTPPHHLPFIYTHYTTLLVTHIFASAAVIYLQTVITTSPSVFHIQDPLQEVMRAFDLVPDPRMVRGLVWPICVAGCMASRKEDQEFFRRLAMEGVKDAGMVGNSGRMLQILECSWTMQREQGQLVDCATCVASLGSCVLLV